MDKVISSVKALKDKRIQKRVKLFEHINEDEETDLPFTLLKLMQSLELPQETIRIFKNQSKNAKPGQLFKPLLQAMVAINPFKHESLKSNNIHREKVYAELQ